MRWAKQPLSLPRAVLWNGRSGATITDIRNLMSRMPGPPPLVIVFHIGTNDLLSVDAFCIRHRILSLMEDTKALYPHAQIVWSDILPRLFYFGTTAQASMDRKRRSINKWAKSRSRKLGGHFIHHPQFSWTTMHLFRYDGYICPKQGFSNSCPTWWQAFQCSYSVTLLYRLACSGEVSILLPIVCLVPLVGVWHFLAGMRWAQELG